MNLVATPLYLSTIDAGFEAEFQARLHWSAQADAAIEQRVADILADVQQRGDAAVLDYTRRFDALDASSLAELSVTPAELQRAFDAIPAAQRQALQVAAQRVRTYHEAQKQATGRSWQYRDVDGTLLGQKVTPLDRVGIYVPGAGPGGTALASVVRGTRGGGRGWVYIRAHMRLRVCASGF